MDGVFGPKTTAALEAFQEDVGIAADGIAGPATEAKLADGQAQVMEKMSSLGKAADDGDGPAPV